MSEPTDAEWEPVEVPARTPNTGPALLHHAHRGAACSACEIVSLRSALAAAQAQVCALRGALQKEHSRAASWRSQWLATASNSAVQAAWERKYPLADVPILSATQSAAEAHDERIREDERRLCAKVAREQRDHAVSRASNHMAEAIAAAIEGSK